MVESFSYPLFMLILILDNSERLKKIFVDHNKNLTRSRDQVLKFLHEAGLPWDEFCCSRAAAHGHNEVLEYLHTHGCPWSAMTCKLAARNGRLEVSVVQYFMSNRQSCSYHRRCRR